MENSHCQLLTSMVHGSDWEDDSRFISTQISNLKILLSSYHAIQRKEIVVRLRKGSEKVPEAEVED